MHFVMLAVFFPTIIAYRFGKDRPPAERAAPMKALWNTRPKWMFAAAILLMLYTFANFLFLAGEDQLRRFSGHWMVFLWTAMLLNYPWASASEEKAPDVSAAPDGFHTEAVPVFRRREYIIFGIVVNAGKHSSRIYNRITGVADGVQNRFF